MVFHLSEKKIKFDTSWSIYESHQIIYKWEKFTKLARRDR